MKTLIFLIFSIFNPGDNSFVFLKNLKDAEDIALGEASCALPCDALSFIFNPALLGGIKNYEASFYSAFLWNNIKENYFAFGSRTKYFNYGISLYYLNYGKIEGRDKFGYKTKDFTPYDFSVHLGIGKNISKFLKLGFAFAYAIEQIEEEKGNSFVFSFGTKYIIPNNPSIKVGFSIINLGTPIKFIRESFSPPPIFKLGALYKKPKTPYLATFEISLPFDHLPFISIGGSYIIKNLLEIRGGFKSSFDTGLISAFRFGFGLTHGIVSLDYAIVPRGILGFTHHIDLKFKF
ncbi:MAG: PorV/PorQ family protein [Candidatus Hydrothermales bacterium]